MTIQFPLSHNETLSEKSWENQPNLKLSKSDEARYHPSLAWHQNQASDNQILNSGIKIAVTIELIVAWRQSNFENWTQKEYKIFSSYKYIQIYKFSNRYIKIQTCN